MIKYLLFISLIAISLLSVSFVYVNDYFLQTVIMLKPDPDCRCQDSPSEDFYERPLRYHRNIYKGTCIDSCKYRYPILVESSQHEKSILVANTFHQQEFWIAQIPLENISRVEVLFENFAPGINHVAFRFIFFETKVLKMHSQNLHSQQKKAYINSIVLSPEAAPPLNHRYNLWDGFMGNYALMNRMVSYESYMEMAKTLNHPIKSYRLNINLEEAQNLLGVLLLDSNNVYHNQYQLIFNNCATTVIDSALQAKNILRSPRWDVWDILDPLRGIPSTQSIGTIRTLHWWRLIGNDI